MSDGDMTITKGLGFDTYISYSDTTNLTASSDLQLESLHVNGESKLTFDKKGKIENVDSIKWSNGSVLTMPSKRAKEGQVLIYNGTGALEWRDVPNFVNLEEIMVNNDDYFYREIQQLRKEIKMYNNVHWGFSDYLSIFLIALLAIWFVKHISWKVVLTPIKKLFKFSEKKMHEAEEELKKAEQTWREIE